MTRLPSESAGPRGQLWTAALVALWEQRRGSRPREGAARDPRGASERPAARGTPSLDYTTVRHHLRVLLKNQVVVTSGPRYGQVYFPSPAMESHWNDLDRILARFQRKDEGMHMPSEIAKTNGGASLAAPIVQA